MQGGKGRHSDKALKKFKCLCAAQGRGGAGLAALPSGEALFVIGGFAGNELNDVHRFDLATRTWDCPACCTGSQGHTCTLPLYDLVTHVPCRCTLPLYDLLIAQRNALHAAQALSILPDSGSTHAANV